jgi:hypothetical protein
MWCVSEKLYVEDRVTSVAWDFEPCSFIHRNLLPPSTLKIEAVLSSGI